MIPVPLIGTENSKRIRYRDYEIIEEILSNDNNVQQKVQRFYHENRGMILDMLKEEGTLTEAQAVLQDGMVALFKFLQKQPAPKEPLSEVFRKICQCIWQQRSSIVMGREVPDRFLEFDIPRDHPINETEALDKLFTKLDPGHWAILKSFYYERKRLPEILKKFGFESEEKAHFQKFESLKRLKNLLKRDEVLLDELKSSF